MGGGSSEMGIAIGKQGIINQEHVKVKTQGHSVTDTKAWLNYQSIQAGSYLQPSGYMGFKWNTVLQLVL